MWTRRAERVGRPVPFPHIESPSTFAAILDPDRSGRFRIGPVQPSEGEQQYVGRTNVLETTFRTTDWTASLTDVMPPARRTDRPKQVRYRTVACLEGVVDRGIAIATQGDLDAPVEAWREVRDTVAGDVLENGTTTKSGASSRPTASTRWTRRACCFPSSDSRRSTMRASRT